VSFDAAFPSGTVARSRAAILSAQQAHATAIVHVQPTIFPIVIWHERRYLVTPELLYTGTKNDGLRARLLIGARYCFDPIRAALESAPMRRIRSNRPYG